mmetsp:Transcript_59908/g.104802  ORF Transcript_59908/g.104802 Transcript_59908/m.104802 type:complete len:302 (-) Transcript_59908:208-1113(-)
MAFGAAADKRPATSAEAEVFAVKRRRITLQDVENELRVAGLCQPALSLFKSSEQDVSLAAPNLVSLKRSREEDPAAPAWLDAQPLAKMEGVVQQPELEKRRRLCSQLEPLYTTEVVVEPLCAAEIQTCISPERALVPYSVGSSCIGPATRVVVGDYSPVIPRPIEGLTTITVDPLGLTFIVGNGYLIAELPASRRPACSWSGEEASKIVLDSTGKAIFLSDEGQILASIPAIRQLENAYDCSSKNLTVQMLSANHEKDGGPLAICVSEENKVAAGEEALSPSTDVPSPSAEDIEEDGMDTD